MLENIQTTKFEPSAIELDLRGYRCPVPVLKLKKALKEFNTGIIKVLTTDPDSINDFKEFARLKNMKISHESIKEENHFWLSIGNTHEQLV